MSPGEGRFVRISRVDTGVYPVSVWDEVAGLVDAGRGRAAVAERIFSDGAG